jgi:hypothetical protein
MSEYNPGIQSYDSGINHPINKFSADPVFAVIDGPDGINKLFTSQRATRLPLGFATAFMAQRCSQSVESWDGYCDLYLKQEQNANFTGKAAKEFIRDTLARMFCQNDTSIPGSQCVERCEMFDPTSDNSVSVCQTQGDLVFRSDESLKAIDTLYPQSGKLSTTEPIRFTKCPKICNIFDAKKLSNSNIPLNISLDQGIAMDLIQNLVDNIVAHRKQHLVTNSRLLRFMKAYVQDGSVKPGLYNIGAGPFVSSRPVAVPAVNPVIPPGVDLIVNEQRPINGPQMIANNEPFGYVDLSDEDDDEAKNKNLLYLILIVSVVAIIFFCLAKRK